MKNQDTKYGAGARPLPGKDSTNTTDTLGNEHSKKNQTLHTFPKPVETKGGQKKVTRDGI